MSSTVKTKKVWEITGWDSNKLLFSYTIDGGQITRKKLDELIRTLTSKISLTEREIISSYAKKGTKAYSNFLDLQYQTEGVLTISCGTNPYVVARVKDAVITK